MPAQPRPLPSSFWTMVPPNEWPMSTGGLSALRMIPAKCSTTSSMPCPAIFSGCSRVPSTVSESPGQPGADDEYPAASKVSIQGCHEEACSHSPWMNRTGRAEEGMGLLEIRAASRYTDRSTYIGWGKLLPFLRPAQDVREGVVGDDEPDGQPADRGDLSSAAVCGPRANPRHGRPALLRRGDPRGGRAPCGRRIRSHSHDPLPALPDQGRPRCRLPPATRRAG